MPSARRAASLRQKVNRRRRLAAQKVERPSLAWPAWLRPPPLLLGNGFAWFAVIVSYLAALGHLSSGTTTMSLQNIFNADTIRTWLMYRGVLLDAGWDLDGWRYFNSTYLLDVTFNWIAYGIGGASLGAGTRSQFLAGMYAMPLVWVLISAWGWVKVCRLVWGKGSPRELAVIGGHALPFLLFALGEEYFFTVMFLQVAHTSTWAVMPWLLYPWLKAMQEKPRGGGRWLCLATLAVFIVTFADFAIAAWFTIPTMLTIALAVLLSRRRAELKKNLRRNWRFVFLGTWVPMLVATFAGKYLSESLMRVSVDANFHNSLGALHNFTAYIVKAWHHTPVLLVAWGVFVVGGVVHLSHRCVRWMRHEECDPRAVAAGPSSPSVQRIFRGLLPLWLTGVVCGTMVTGIMGGLADPLEHSVHWGTELRYYLPAFWLPFVIGVALLPWAVPARFVAGASGLLATACVVTLTVQPFDPARLDPFNNDFQRCFVDLATTHGWEGGMGSYWYTWLLADPQVQLRRHLRTSHVGGGIVASATNGHPSWGKGRVDFFVITEIDPIDTMYPPLDPQAKTCNGIRREKCMDGRRMITEEAVRDKFEKDFEIMECDNVKFAVFAQPKHFDFDFI